MSRPQPPKPAKLIVGVILQDKTLFPTVAQILASAFGAVDMVSPWFDFDFTQYYAPEMGSPLFRRLLVFQTLVDQEALADIKLRTNAIESQFLRDARRRINIDPGYLLYERFVLASGKNFSHRIYIGKGIYADLTLVFQKGSFQTLAWTYPDYKAQTMREFLLQARRLYASNLTARANDN